LVEVIVRDDTTSSINITSLIKINEDVKVLIPTANAAKIIRPRIMNGDRAKPATVSKSVTSLLLIAKWNAM
jgi:hypothetical protein